MLEAYLPEIAAAFAAAVVVPLGVRVVDEPDRRGRRSRAMATASWLSWPAGALAAASFLLAPGALAVAMCAPYFLFAALVALHGAMRLAARGLRPASELGVGAGAVFLAGAAVWLGAHRAGVALLDYPPYWVALTATHFQVAGFALPVIAGMHARRGTRIGALAVWLVVLGVPATAILFESRLAPLAAITTATGGVLVAIEMWRADGVHALAAAPLGVAMPLAAAYALGVEVRIGGLDILSSMAASHGALDLAFATGALAALCWTRPAPAWARGVPFSRLAAGRRVGHRWYEETGLATGATPTGLVDRLEELEHAGFDAAAAAPEVRAFYEQTASHRMTVTPHWRRGFRLGGRLWAAFGRRIGQLGLPVAAESGAEPIASRIVGVDAARDGRPGVRGWVRSFEDGRTMYVAAYATHGDGRGNRYMNIAFPLPGGHMTSILRVDPIDGGGVAVSTVRAGAASDCGVYFVFGPLVVRSPFAEEIRVWLDDAGALVARHDVWIFGVRFLSLDYEMEAIAGAPSSA